MSALINRISLLALLHAGLGAAHATDVHIGASMHGQVMPGVYGRVDIGNAPPQLVYAQPVVIVQEPHYATRRPIYLHVPPGHAKNWGKHCRRYNACAQPVYFVKSAEYGSYKRKNKKHKHHRDEHRHERHHHHHYHRHGHHH